MITVFIPAYNAHDSIDYGVMSLVSQTARDFMKIVIINDGSERDYQEVINKFSPYIQISEFKHEKNMGVGRARQTALDILDTKYFAFLDSDDIYIDSTVFEFFYRQMESNPDYVAIFGQYYEEIDRYSYKIQDRTDVWVCGKIYRSSFIKKNNLTFPPVKGNEDNVFNISLGGSLKSDEIIVNYEKPIYLWKLNKNSITRKNNSEYWFNGDLDGLVEGIYYIKDNPNISKNHLQTHIKATFFHLYFRYHDILSHRAGLNLEKNILQLAKKLYSDFLKDDNEWLEEESIRVFLDSVVLDFQKKYNSVAMFRDFLEMVK